MATNILNSRFSSLEVHEKEDIIQNVFSKLLNGGLRNFRGATGYEFLGYFKIIVTNEANTFLTSVNRNKTLSLDDENGMTLDVPSETTRPDRLFEKKEMLGLIGAAIQEYPLEDRQLFLLKARGHKDKEVSAILGLPMGTVASKYNRIVEKLRKDLGE